METMTRIACAASACLLLGGISTPVLAQFGVSVSSPEIAAPTINATYAHSADLLTVMVETRPANDEGYLFVHPGTGAVLGALRLDAKHGARLSPDGAEIRIAGSRQTDQLDPVYFAGRYRRDTLEPIATRQIDVSRDNGFGLSGELTADGGFLFRGAHPATQVNVVAKYTAEFTRAWSVALTYGGRFDGPFIETYPLEGGAVGFMIPVNTVGDTGIGKDFVFGLLDGDSGQLLWSVVAPAVQTPTSLEDLRFGFGRDGSLWLARVSTSLLGTPPDSVGLVRVSPGGVVAYSRSVTVPGATFQWQYYFGDRALLAFTYKEGAEDRILWIVLDPSGGVVSSTVLNCQLRGGGRIRFTAAQREGTPYAFVRFEAGLPGASPQATLGRLHLDNGTWDLRQLPAATLTSGRHDLVTTPPGDHLSPFNNAAGLPAVTTTLFDILTSPLGGAGALALYELPSNGDFPDCFPFRASSVAVGTPRIPEVADAQLLRPGAAATAAPLAMPGMTEALLLPSVQALPFNLSVICEDDAGAEAPVIRLEPAGLTDARILFDALAGVPYRIEQSVDLKEWTLREAVTGAGSPVTHPVAAPASPTYYRVTVGNGN